MSVENVQALADLHAAQQELATSRPHLDMYSPAGNIAALAALGAVRARRLAPRPVAADLPDSNELLEELYGPPAALYAERYSLLDEQGQNYNGDNETEIIQW